MVVGMGLYIGLFVSVDAENHGDLGTEMLLAGIGVALFMLGIAFQKKSTPPGPS